MRLLQPFLTAFAVASICLPAVAPANESLAAPPDGGDWYFSIGGGDFNPDTGGRIENRSGQYALFLDVGHAFNRYLSVSVDLWSAAQRYDTPAAITPPPLGTVEGRIDLTTSGVSVVGKLGYPVGSFRPYAGAGVGLFFSKARIGGSVIGFPASAEEDDSAMGEMLLAGVDVRLSTSWTLGIEYRQVFLDGNFGVLSNGEIDLGGANVMATLRWWGPSGATQKQEQ